MIVVIHGNDDTEEPAYFGQFWLLETRIKRHYLSLRLKTPNTYEAPAT